jgi:hypothetical protein
MFGKLFGPALKGMSKLFSSQKLWFVCALLIAVWVLNRYAKPMSMVVDPMQDGEPAADISEAEKKPEAKEVAASSGNTASGNGYATHEVANPSELLPTDENSQWAALNPAATNKGDTTMPDLLKAGYHIGLDTIGQTLRNANLQLRSDPVISKAEVGPWNQSTIETDYARTPLEIGPSK